MERQQPPRSEWDLHSNKPSAADVAPYLGAQQALGPEPPEPFYHLITRLNPYSPVRRIAEAILYRNHRPLDNVQPLFTSLADPVGHAWEECAVSAWALGHAHLTPQEADAAGAMLLEALENSPRVTVWRSLRRGLAWSYGLMLPISLLISLAIGLSDDRDPWPEIFLPMLLVFGSLSAAVAFPASLVYGKVCNNRRDWLRAAAATSLGRLQVSESAGALARALFDRSPHLRDAAAAALHNLLPTLTEEHYGLFGVHSMQYLGKALSHPDSLLVFKLLGALEKVGNIHVIPYVQRLAKDGRMVRMRDAAVHVLAMIEARMDAELEAGTLMRAATSPARFTDQLLRPAHDYADAESSEQALRADRRETL